MTRRVGYSPQAQRHLTDLYDWIAHESGFPDRAEAYVTALMDRCDALADLNIAFGNLPRHRRTDLGAL